MKLVRCPGLLLLVAMSLAPLSACNETSKSCNITEDQRGSFMSRVGEFSVPIAVDSAFDGSERNSLAYAVEQWNLVGRRIGNPTYFVISGTTFNASREQPTLDDCGENIPGSGNTLVFQKVSTQAGWAKVQTQAGRASTSVGPTSVGVTFRCTIGDEAERQISVINTSRISSAQLSSVMLHELGHALGLNHSCDSGKGSSNYRSCTGLASSHPYRVAVMYPTLQLPDEGSSMIEIKDRLQANDSDRAECLYGAQ
jgi:hypothetical protein